MPQQQIIRFETRTGKGAYRAAGSYKILNGKHNTWEKHPLPGTDINSKGFHSWDYRWYYGFTSEWQARRWFVKEVREKLANIGVHPYLFTLKDGSPVHAGRKQCAFDKNDVISRERIEL